MTNKPKLRNRHAANPIMRKGGVHDKSKSAKRAEEKRDTRRNVDTWQREER